MRSQPKREHIAAAHLRELDGIEVFHPRIRFQRSTRQGKRWVTESLFPNYLFARYDAAAQMRRVRHAPSVSSVVRFGGQWPEIPPDAIHELRESLDGREVATLNPQPENGSAVRISGGSLHGLRAVVANWAPGKERVRVLIEFLGRQTLAEVGATSLVLEDSPRFCFIRAAA